jgi:hypothetical protein
MYSGFGIGACVLLRFVAPLTGSAPDLDVWDHWKKPTVILDISPEQGPVLVTVEYMVSSEKVPEFLDAIYKYQRIRRRDGASRWGIFYDTEIPGRYLESFIVDSWGEHERQHARFTVADRKIEERVVGLALQPPKTRHFISAKQES